MQLIVRGILVVIICSLCGVIDAEAAAKVTITQTSESAYSVTVADVDKAAAIDYTITYDKDTLSNPVIADGRFATDVKAIPVSNNDTVRGLLRVVYITTSSFNGGGLLSTVTFTKSGNTVSRQPELKSEIYSVDGIQVSAQPIVTPRLTTTAPPSKEEDTAGKNGNGSVTGTTVAASGSTQVNSTGTVSAGQPQATGTSIGTVTLPQDSVGKNEPGRQESRLEERRDEPVYKNESAKNGGSTPVSGEAIVAAKTEAKTDSKTTSLLPGMKSIQSVSNSFRAYKDIRTMKKLSALFDDANRRSAGFNQAPAIVVSDGKSVMTVTINLQNETDTPSFSLKGANQKSIRRVSDKKWELVALPQKGKSDVRLSIISKGEHTDIPLLVVPPLDKNGLELLALPDAALDALLVKPLKNGKPVYDLNSDGKQDFFDDYVLVAHWLLKQQRNANGAGKKPAAVAK